jgi:hypothetical protein
MGGGCGRGQGGRAEGGDAGCEYNYCWDEGEGRATTSGGGGERLRQVAGLVAEQRGVIVSARHGAQQRLPAAKRREVVCGVGG